MSYTTIMTHLFICVCLCVQEFLQALAIIADECGLELIDAAVQLGADPTYLHGMCPEVVMHCE